jgi:ParB family transcriptional regulator, chromosome partitioning protein
MVKKGGLGRGLDALIPVETQQHNGDIPLVALDSIVANPRQPRKEMAEEELKSLAASIREHGILQPLIVTTDGIPDRYILIAGERRLRAARLAGLEVVPVIVRQATDQERLELALIENVQRADLSPLETAEAYAKLSDEFGLSHEEIAVRVGKNRATVTNTMRLLKLSDSAKTALASGKISEGHARTLLSLNSPQAQSAALQSIITNDLNVRQTEELVHKMSGEKQPAQPKAAVPEEIKSLEERLQTHLGTRVNLHHGKKGGSLVIHYYSDEELNSLVSQILQE